MRRLLPGQSSQGNLGREDEEERRLVALATQLSLDSDSESSTAVPVAPAATFDEAEAHLMGCTVELLQELLQSRGGEGGGEDSVLEQVAGRCSAQVRKLAAAIAGEAIGAEEHSLRQMLELNQRDGA